jgi:hypothetical protein
MIDVTDGADVAMRLVPLKLCFCHFILPFGSKNYSVLGTVRARIGQTVADCQAFQVIGSTIAIIF